MSKGTLMITDLIIRKNNVLTDGNIPDRKVLTEKVANVLYHYHAKEGKYEFKISIPELLRILELNIKSGDNQQRLKDAIQILQSPIQIRNFDYKGKSISWFSAPFLSRAYIEKGYTNIINFKLDDMLIEALKQQETFTEIDISITNKFKTKYGITIYHMYLRYKNMPNSQESTFIYKTLEELNKKFHTKYRTQSEMMRTLKRGVKEIQTITGVTIYITWEKEQKCFKFLWERGKSTAPATNSEISEPSQSKTELLEKRFEELANNLSLLNYLDLSVEFGINENDVELTKEFHKYIGKQLFVFFQYCRDNNKNYKNLATSFKQHIRGAYKNNLDFFSSELFLQKEYRLQSINEMQQNQKIKEFLQNFEGKKLCEYFFKEYEKTEDIYVLDGELYARNKETKGFIPLNNREQTIEIINSLKR